MKDCRFEYPNQFKRLVVSFCHKRRSLFSNAEKNGNIDQVRVFCSERYWVRLNSVEVNDREYVKPLMKCCKISNKLFFRHRMLLGVYSFLFQ